LFKTLSQESSFKFPFPIGNILGGGVHAGPGTPDIQEILICATGSKTIEDAIETNLAVHKELRCVLEKEDPNFTNGRGDEGGWAPKLENQKALEVSAKACENLGFTLGKEVSLGVDFASSTQWNEGKQKYVYDRAGFENSTGEQIDFAANIIEKYKLIYAEDAVHEEAFEDMAELTAKFPNMLITGDDLIVTSKEILIKAIDSKSCNAAILKVNQAGSLYDALEFASVANQNNIKLITSHRSGESIDSQISHIGLATKSKMLKVGVVGGERIAKINEKLDVRTRIIWNNINPALFIA
jgi:enolase